MVRRRLHGRRSGSAGRALLYVGVLASACVVPLAVDPLGYNPFGPANVALVATSWAIVLAGFAAQPSLAVQGWTAIRSTLSAKVLGIFIGLTGLSTLLSIDSLQSLVGSYPEYQGVLTLVAYLTVGLAVVTLMVDDAEGFWATFGRGLAVTVSLLCLLALVQRIGLDPINGVQWIGRGSALAGLGRWGEAVESYESGVERAYRLIPGWLSLDVAYEQTGLFVDAEAARARAASIAAEDRAMGAMDR